MKSVGKSWFTIACCILLATLSLTACGGGNSNSNNPPPDNNNPQPQPPPITPPTNQEPDSALAEALRELEKSGAIPVLDRSGTIQGVDDNNDGVRDDIEEYIESLPDTPEQKSALRQMYKALSSAMLSGTGVDSPTETSDASRKIANAVNCLAEKYPDDYYDKMNDIRKNTINTKIRFNAYAEYNEKLSGSILSLPEGNTCE